MDTLLVLCIFWLIVYYLYRLGRWLFGLSKKPLKSVAKTVQNFKNIHDSQEDKITELCENIETRETEYVLPELRLHPEKNKRESPILVTKNAEPQIIYDGDVPHIERFEIKLWELKSETDDYRPIFTGGDDSWMKSIHAKRKKQKQFYTKFKENFLNDIYMPLNGNYYYAELLLEDICGGLLQNMQDTSSKNKLRKYVKNIATHYGESIYVLSYCDYFNDKIGITINDNEYYYFSDYPVTSGYFKLFLQKNINVTAVKPILDWIYNSNNFYCRNMRILINQDKTIDCIKMEYSNRNTCCKVTLIDNTFPDYIQFRKVECDFIILNEKKNGNNIICYKHDIKSLRGCPTYVDGNFVCAKLGLTSLEYCPIKVNGNLNASRNKISRFTSVNVGGVLDLTYNKINNESIETIKNDNNIIVNASHIDVDHNDLPKYTAKYFHR